MSSVPSLRIPRFNVRNRRALPWYSEHGCARSPHFGAATRSASAPPVRTVTRGVRSLVIAGRNCRSRLKTPPETLFFYNQLRHLVRSLQFALAQPVVHAFRDSRIKPQQRPWACAARHADRWETANRPADAGNSCQPSASSPGFEGGGGSRCVRLSHLAGDEFDSAGHGPLRCPSEHLGARCSGRMHPRVQSDDCVVGGSSSRRNRWRRKRD